MIHALERLRPGRSMVSGHAMAAHAARLCTFAIVLWCGAAVAIQQVRSLYTAVDPSLCRPLGGGDSGGAARLCEGLPGYPVYIAEGSRGVYLSVGPNADKRRAARQTLSSFNTLFDRGGRRTTVEWRFVVRDRQTVPYATIVRYFTQSATDAGQVLVVMRVTDREVCHVAYVDALANLDAIVLARKLADTVARSKPCPQEPSVQGAQGRSPM
ncbi:hypothetical protein [Hyphomicrobium sp.]|uniref:hypothetical protein n=1 Tax=Hyphomicrobium sp. TaxID=82 RepID=UPI0025B868A6|nr:hypothetical protein [Hyphomicrobium sp.]MCC7253532.1 hypothetical protein [Hyphomicrobium sp.]